MNNIFPALLVGVGAVLMVHNICSCFSLFRQLSCLRYHGKPVSKLLLLLYVALLCFFLIGYIVVGVCLWNPLIEINHIMVGAVFLFGSIFVMLGIRLQMSMSKSIQKSNLDITQALIAAVEARDTNLNGHSVHVARLVKTMYPYLPREDRRTLNPNDLEYAALLHDVGKLGVPEVILNKEGALDPDEWIEIQKHPQIGKNILGALDGFQDISNWVLYHHERCDGGGYMGASYADIPLPSRIIAVADTFSAITMKRSYRAAKSYEQACAILRECSGTQLDRDLVELFLRIPRDEIERCQYEFDRLNRDSAANPPVTGSSGKL